MLKIDLTGRINGAFKVISEATPHETTGGQKIPMWNCECTTCKTKVVVNGNTLRKGVKLICNSCFVDSPEMMHACKEHAEVLNQVAKDNNRDLFFDAQKVRQIYLEVEGLFTSADSDIA